MLKEVGWWWFHGGRLMFLSFLSRETKFRRKKKRIWERNLNIGGDKEKIK